MSFFGNIVSGLGKVAEAAGQGLLIVEWRDTFRNEGTQMLQVKIRDFLRTAPEEDKDRMQKFLENQVTNFRPSPADRKAFTQVLEIYIDQLG